MSSYTTLKILSKIVTHLPYSVVLKIGSCIGFLFGKIAKKQRKRAYAQIRATKLFKEEEIPAIMNRMFKNLGKNILEFVHTPALNKENIDEYIHCSKEDLAKIKAFIDLNKGGLFISGHISNWEWLSFYLAFKGVPMAVVAKPQPNKNIDRFLNETREATGVNLYASGTSQIRGCLSALKNKQVVALAMDQDGDINGTFVPFLNRMSSTVSGVAYFSKKFAVPTLPIFLIRNENGVGHRVVVKDIYYYEDTGDKEKDDYAIIKRSNEEIEQIIIAHPDNWVWFMKRWNTKCKKE
jgi:KDO2-lipid IV(A) lauroyltransferase